MTDNHTGTTLTPDGFSTFEEETHHGAIVRCHRLGWRCGV
jgi:hypothetical protein